MQELLVAVFDSVPRTQQAVQALHSGGIPDSAIRCYRKDDGKVLGDGDLNATRAAGATAESRPTTGGFWAWLLGEEGDGGYYPEYEHARIVYDRAMKAGNTVVAVTVDDKDAPRALDILSAHAPLELEEVGQAAQGAAASPQATIAPQTRPAGGQEERIPLAEEQVSIGKRQVERGTTKIHRYVVREPVEKQVMLKDERVEIERRKPVSGTHGGEFQERTVEVRETTEEPVVTKTARPVEEVVVRKQVTERPETVRDEVRKEKVKIEKPTRRG